MPCVAVSPEGVPIATISIGRCSRNRSKSVYGRAPWRPARLSARSRFRAYTAATVTPGMALAARACVSLMFPAPTSPMCIPTELGRQVTFLFLSHAQPDRLFDVPFVDQRRLFGRARVVGHGIELDDGPTAILHLCECCEHALHVHRSASELHEPVSAARWAQWVAYVWRGG